MRARRIGSRIGSLACAALVALVLAAWAGAGEAEAAGKLVARISLKAQRMEVTVDGWQRYSWPVSTARRGYRTPIGTFRPTRLHKRYFSRKYNNAPMPHSVFFYHGYAIHGTTEIRTLGRPASHGCVRLHPDHARKLFSLVKRHGRRNTRIVVTR